MVAIQLMVEQICPVQITDAERFFRVRIVADAPSDIGEAVHNIDLGLVLPRNDSLSVAKISEQARLKGAEVLRQVAEYLEKNSGIT